MSGADVAVTNLSWNGALAANATTTFGLTGGSSGTPVTPTPICRVT
ncbi:cellulose binding domain-containing protein [Phytohabitans sp. LJ34]